MKIAYVDDNGMTQYEEIENNKPSNAYASNASNASNMSNMSNASLNVSLNASPNTSPNIPLSAIEESKITNEINEINEKNKISPSSPKPQSPKPQSPKPQSPGLGSPSSPGLEINSNMNIPEEEEEDIQEKEETIPQDNVNVTTFPPPLKIKSKSKSKPKFKKGYEEIEKAETVYISNPEKIIKRVTPAGTRFRLNDTDKAALTKLIQTLGFSIMYKEDGAEKDAIVYENDEIKAYINFMLCDTPDIGKEDKYYIRVYFGHVMDTQIKPAVVDFFNELGSANNLINSPKSYKSYNSNISTKRSMNNSNNSTKRSMNNSNISTKSPKSPKSPKKSMKSYNSTKRFKTPRRMRHKSHKSHKRRKPFNRKYTRRPKPKQRFGTMARYYKQTRRYKN